MRSAVVLAGGEARRANGQEKYFFTYEGKTFIERLIDSLSGVVDEIIIVARSPAQCARFLTLQSVTCISDIRQGLGPIGGLHAGSLAARGDLVFVSACDMPCIDPEVVSYLFNAVGAYDAAIPRWNEQMVEPLHAVYRRTALLAYLESHTSLSLRTMIQTLNTRYVPVNELRVIDPGLMTFTNINKLEELDRINLCSGKEPGEPSP
ncbi:molybdenum cofactor guanylyltransferase [Methanoregula sp.]|uniref:molybdenum cofactor guanylyltransferase n=1 Tax=Methanoregula sp. TaxID=2052170 RepID=UPI002C70743A|nr:molybdenum cofactor guanylyltransferase [Methanoregula sp.]HVP97325.1 molybdenum cofactor guanylyltransferase [Methanoregula sp.]